MPSYADMKGTTGLASPINAAYYSVDSPASSAASLPLSSPPSSCRVTRNGVPPSTTGTPLVSKMLKFTSEHTKAIAHKYEALANKESSVKLSALPAKLQPTLSGFDIEGDGMIDTTELGRATQMYQQYKARKAFAWLRVLGVLACLFVAAYGISRATVYVTEARYSRDGDLVDVTSSGFQATVATALMTADSYDAAAAVANSTYVPVSELLSVTVRGLHRLTHVSLNVDAEEGVTKEVFYTVTGFEKVGRDMLKLWTNRPGEEVLVVPGHAYRTLPPSTPGLKPRAEDVLDSEEGYYSDGSMLSSGLFVGGRPEMEAATEDEPQRATTVVDVSKEYDYRGPHSSTNGP